MPGSRSERDGRRSTRDSEYSDRGEKKGMNLAKIFAISFLVVLGVVLVSGGLIYKFGHDMYSNVNYVDDNEVKVEETLPQEAEEETLNSEDRTGVAVDESELASIQENMVSAVSDKETVSDEDVYNVLLIGVDRRDKSWNGNSDCMILVSINKERNRVTMVSLMRDTYVNIPGKGYAKLNQAYAYGAGPLLCETVTETYKVEVERYAAVDFTDLVSIIDLIGGVDLEVSAAEASVVNGYIDDMCQNILNVSTSDHLLPSSGGYIHCDGVQAVCYARNRYVGNSDFERTERQRYVLTQLMEEVKQMSVAQMTEKMQGILEYVTMNIPESEIWSMLAELPDMLDYDFETSRIPYDNEYETIYVNQQDMLVPDWDTTLDKLHEFIYGD